MRSLALLSIILLMGCTLEKSCQWDYNWRTNQALRAELFDKCLMRAAEARKGISYTTHNSEDYDDVVKACDGAAYAMSRYCIYQ